MQNFVDGHDTLVKVLVAPGFSVRSGIQIRPFHNSAALPAAFGAPAATQKFAVAHDIPPIHDGMVNRPLVAHELPFHLAAAVNWKSRRAGWCDGGGPPGTKRSSVGPATMHVVADVHVTAVGAVGMK